MHESAVRGRPDCMAAVVASEPQGASKRVREHGQTELRAFPTGHPSATLQGLHGRSEHSQPSSAQHDHSKHMGTSAISSTYGESDRMRAAIAQGACGRVTFTQLCIYVYMVSYIGTSAVRRSGGVTGAAAGHAIVGVLFCLFIDSFISYVVVVVDDDVDVGAAVRVGSHSEPGGYLFLWKLAC